MREDPQSLVRGNEKLLADVPGWNHGDEYRGVVRLAVLKLEQNRTRFGSLGREGRASDSAGAPQSAAAAVALLSALLDRTRNGISPVCPTFIEKNDMGRAPERPDWDADYCVGAEAVKLIANKRGPASCITATKLPTRS